MQACIAAQWARMAVAYNGTSLKGDRAAKARQHRGHGPGCLASCGDGGEQNAELFTGGDHTGRQLTPCPRSSISQQIGAIGDAGGVNSINNFARSWQRAAGFFEITPVRPSFRVETEEDEPSDFPRTGLASPTPPDQRSALRRALQEGDRRASDNAVVDEEHGPTEETHLLPNAVLRARGESIFNIEPSLSSPFGGSYGTGYGSLSARVNDSSMRHAGRLFTDQKKTGTL
jgi:hypothetical protein